MSFPKHKPASLDERTPGARDHLYAGNFDSNGRMKNWEGIEAAQKRQKKSTLTPEQIADSILSRLYIRLGVADGSIDHRDRTSGKQVRVDPRITKNLIGQLVRVTKGIQSAELRESIANQVKQIRTGFKNT